MDYNFYANQLSKKLTLAVMQGPFAERCFEGLLQCVAGAIANALEKYGYTSSREVIFCKTSKGGRVEVGIVVDGVTDQAVLDRLEGEAYRKCFNGSRWLLDELGYIELQVYFTADSEWPEVGYATGRPDDPSLRWAQLY